MVSIFRNQSLDWYDSEVRLGYMGEQTHSLFGPLDNVTFFSLFNTGTVPYYNEIYQLSIDGAKLKQVQPGKKMLPPSFATKHYSYVCILSPHTALIRAHIDFTSTETYVELVFDLAVDNSTCNTTQFSLQTLDKVHTFRPTYETRCEQPILYFYYTSEDPDNRLSFSLHPSDHILLHETTLVPSITSFGVAVSIGSSFVHTRGLTAAVPVYFLDNFIATTNVNPQVVDVSPLNLELDMTRAEFHMWLDTPVTANMSQIQLSCEEQSEVTTVSGVWSTPVPSDNTLQLSMKMSPDSFAAICYNLLCIESNYAMLQHISYLNDVFGNQIEVHTFRNSFVSKELSHHYCLLLCNHTCRYQ